MVDRQQHWEDVFARKADASVSWFQEVPTVSLDLVTRCAPTASSRIIDVGAGASRLVDELVARGFEDVTVLDVSANALARTASRLGDRAAGVTWVVADVTAFDPPRPFSIWHDRAVFHFLTSHADRAAYAEVLERAVAPGGYAIVGTFALEGPERCSGLPIVRYDAAGLAGALGPAFTLVQTLRHDHVTPSGSVQPFTFVRMVRA